MNERMGFRREVLKSPEEVAEIYKKRGERGVKIYKDSLEKEIKRLNIDREALLKEGDIHQAKVQRIDKKIEAIRNALNGTGTTIGAEGEIENTGDAGAEIKDEGGAESAEQAEQAETMTEEPEASLSGFSDGEEAAEAVSPEMDASEQEPEGSLEKADVGGKKIGTYTVFYDAQGNIKRAMPNFFNRQTMTSDTGESRDMRPMTKEELEKFREKNRQKKIEAIKKGKKKGIGKKIVTVALILPTLIGVGASINAKEVNIDQRTGAVEEMSGWEIENGYDKAGLYIYGNKTAEYNFACGDDVAEVTKVNGEIDECEMIKYVAKNQVESFADYLGNLPDVVKPDEYKGMTILEIEDKLEGLSQGEYESILQQFNNIIDNAFADTTTISGTFENAYMRPIDRDSAITHENIELVRGTNQLDNTKAIRFYWTDEDGKVLGEMYAMWNCLQAGQLSGSVEAQVYSGMPEITENPEGPVTPIPEPAPEPVPPVPPPTPPEPKPKPDPSEEIKKKDAENLERIDENILEDAADDIGTEKVVVHQEEAGELTEEPTSEAYDGTEATTVQNDASKSAETVTPTERNNYSEDRGGANSGEYAPVEENTQGQSEADENETPVSEAEAYSDEEWQEIVDELIAEAEGKGQ